MARMYPDRLPVTVESDAERKLFDLLRNQLGDNFTVFAGVDWMRFNKRGQARPAEADFVVLHPDRGMLVLEVKGGGIAYDARSGTWVSRDRHGAAHTIKDPVEQAKSAYFDLIESLQSARESAPFKYPGGHAVVFPDGVVDGVQLPLDMPRHLVIDASDLDDLPGRLQNLYNYWCKDDPNTPGEAGVQAATDILARSWEIRTPLSLSIQDEAEQIRTLTESQFQLLGFLANHPRALIQGCAGSGKTFLAVEKARRLASQGADTLLTCYNKALAGWIRESLTPLPPNLRVQHFHELAYETGEKVGLVDKGPGDLGADVFFNSYLPEKLLEALGYLDTRYDAIIVDEGQDFREDWWIPLLELLRDPQEGVFYVFYDARQCIYTEDVSVPFDAPAYPLNQNLRNTREIHDYIADYYGDGVTSLGPEGRPPVILRTADPDAALQQQLARLAADDRVPLSDIVILTPASERRSRWQTGQRMGRYSLTWLEPPGEREVLVSTIHSFKGLESPVIILTEFDPDHDDEGLHLVACSRAKHELVVIEEIGGSEA